MRKGRKEEGKEEEMGKRRGIAGGTRTEKRGMKTGGKNLCRKFQMMYIDTSSLKKVELNLCLA